MTDERRETLFGNMLYWIGEQEEGEMLISVLKSIGFTDEEIKQEILKKEF
jgi:hypothetical protein